MKKQLLLFVTILSVATSTFAVEVEINGLWFEVVSKTKEATVIKYKNNIQYSGAIEIPEIVEYEGENYNVTSIGNSAFYNCYNLTSVIIPNSVTSIGKRAFQWCEYMTTVTISNSIDIINDYSFSCCKRLNSVIIPNSVTTIGACAFERCISLTTITIPEKVTGIGGSAFLGCIGLTSVTIPNSVTSIDGCAFQRCTNLTTIEIPNSLTSIKNDVFRECSGLTSISIPSTVKDIGNYAFLGCSGLTSVTIPDGVTSIGERAFDDCSSLSIIKLGSNVSNISYKAFSNCQELTDFFCYTENLPTTKSDAFSGSHIEYATLHVPVNLIDSYKMESPWSDFKDIVALNDETGITQVSAKAVLIQSNGNILSVSGAEHGTDITVYNAAGQRVGSANASSTKTDISTSLRSGDVGIVKIGDKSVKVLMK